jgi:hypothetical protein
MQYLLILKYATEAKRSGHHFVTIISGGAMSSYMQNCEPQIEWQNFCSTTPDFTEKITNGFHFINGFNIGYA